MNGVPQPASVDDRSRRWQTLAVSSAALAAVVVLDAVLTVAARPCRWSWMSLLVPLCAAPVAVVHLDPGRVYRRSAGRRLWLLVGLCAAGAVPAYLTHPEPSAVTYPAGLALHLLVIAMLYHRRRPRGEGAPAPVRPLPDPGRTGPQGR